MPYWTPDWEGMMAQAPEFSPPPGEGYVYLIADSHLGTKGAPTGEFFEMLQALPDARMVVFLGDLFRVWLAMPKFWDRHIRQIIRGFRKLQRSGVLILFVVGNREFFLPENPKAVKRRRLPFDHIALESCVLNVDGLRYGLAHGDMINREDVRHLKWRKISRSKTMEWIFRLIPGWLARSIANRLEKALAKTNMEIKVQYPVGEIQAFAKAVVGDLEAFMVGHFHREDALPVPGHKGRFLLVPDWLSRKIVYRLDGRGEVARLAFVRGEGFHQLGSVDMGTGGTAEKKDKT